jgi:hypothetical protein
MATWWALFGSAATVSRDNTHAAPRYVSNRRIMVKKVYPVYFRNFLMWKMVIDLSLFQKQHESNLFSEEILVAGRVDRVPPTDSCQV